MIDVVLKDTHRKLLKIRYWWTCMNVHERRWLGKRWIIKMCAVDRTEEKFTLNIIKSYVDTSLKLSSKFIKLCNCFRWILLNSRNNFFFVTKNSNVKLFHTFWTVLKVIFSSSETGRVIKHLRNYSLYRKIRINSYTAQSLPTSNSLT